MIRKRNVSIIAHIDHGKSTLADSMINYCGNKLRKVSSTPSLDSLSVEKERGITVLSQCVKLIYKDVEINLIDTPGHVDFSAEVTKSLAACEGAILIVDASQGVQTQTVANLEKAKNLNLKIIPVINKIDLPSAELERTHDEIQEIINYDRDMICVSGKTGELIETLFEEIINVIPGPKINPNAKFRAFVLRSNYDSYEGHQLLVRIFDGKLKIGDRINFTNLPLKDGIYVKDLYWNNPYKTNTEKAESGDIVYISTHYKMTFKDEDDNGLSIIGSTLCMFNDKVEDIRTFEPQVKIIFCNLIPKDNKPEDLSKAVKKLYLEDSSFSYKEHDLQQIGYCIQCGFLGILHMEIIRERLRADFNIDTDITSPSISYMYTKDKKEIISSSIEHFPEDNSIVKEQWTKTKIFTNNKYLNTIIDLCKDRRGTMIEYVRGVHFSTVQCELALGEIVFNFGEQLKTKSSGTASLHYDLIDYRESKLTILKVYINDTIEIALSSIVHVSKIEERATIICDYLKEFMPRANYKQIIQVRWNAKVIRSAHIAQYRKDVTAKCYGRDSSRRKKLLENQKEGKQKAFESSKGKSSIPDHIISGLMKKW